MTSHSNTPQPQRAGDQGAPPTELVVDVGPIAHGGHFVARHEGASSSSGMRSRGRRSVSG